MAYDGTKYISILCCFCCFGMMSVGPEVITMYVGEAYLYLIPWFNLWLLCTLGTHNQAISSLILAGSDIRAISYSSIVASVLGLLVAWFTIPYYDIGGVCIAFAVYCIIQLLFFYFYYWPKKMAIRSSRVFNRSFLPYVLIGIAVSSLSSYIPCTGWILSDFFCKGLIFAVLYILFVWHVLSPNDKKFILSIDYRKK